MYHDSRVAVVQLRCSFHHSLVMFIHKGLNQLHCFLVFNGLWPVCVCVCVCVRACVRACVGGREGGREKVVVYERKGVCTCVTIQLTKE